MASFRNICQLVHVFFIMSYLLPRFSSKSAGRRFTCYLFVCNTDFRWTLFLPDIRCYVLGISLYPVSLRMDSISQEPSTPGHARKRECMPEGKHERNNERTNPRTEERLKNLTNGRRNGRTAKRTNEHARAPTHVRMHASPWTVQTCAGM